jgi:catechol 2,3-dioxygenase-like lactoylglutathione lyase family enzyme
MQVKAVLETCLYTDDLDAAEVFYRDVLGLKVVSRLAGRHVFFRCGQQMVLCFNPIETSKGGELPPHGVRGEGHVAFAISMHDLEGWHTHLTRKGVTIETEYTWPGGGKSLYFRDPHGNSVELTTPAIWSIDEDRV